MTVITNEAATDMRNMDAAREFAHEMVTALASRVAREFIETVEHMDRDHICSIVDYLEKSDPLTAVDMLRGILFTSDSDTGVENLNIVDRCSDYDEDIYELFMEEFFDYEDVNWYLIDNWLRDAARKIISNEMIS